MKKKVIITAAITLFSQVVFAASPALKASGNDRAVDIVERNNEIFQTKYTKSGLGVTVGAKYTNSKLRYDLEIINNSDDEVYFDTNYIRVFQGNESANKWYSMRYKNSGYPVTSNDEAMPSDNGLTLAEGIAAGVIVGVIAIGAFLLFNAFRDSDDDDSPVFDFPQKGPTGERPHRRPGSGHHHRRDPHTTIIVHHDITDDILFWNFIDSIDDDDVALDLNGFDTLNSGNIRRNKSLYGSFYIDQGIGPDYKIEIDIPGEEKVSFVFHSNNKNMNQSPEAYGYKAQRDHKLAIAYGKDVLNESGGSAYLMYLTNPIGGYFSAGFRLADSNLPMIGEVNNHDLSAIKFKGNSGEFIPDGSFTSDAFNISAGLTAKICPCLWLLGGCGVDLTYRYINGNFDTGTTTYTGCIKDNDPLFVFVPQIGLDFSYSFMDFGTMFKYPINGKPQLEVMFGLAF